MNATESQNVAAYEAHLKHDPASAHIDTLKQRCQWLTARIKAKQSVGWDVVWDTRERDSLTWAIRVIEGKLTK